MSKRTILFLFFAFLCSVGHAAEENPNYAAPSVLPHIARVMKTAGFWIGRVPNPDNVILSPDAIDRFNAKIRDEQNLTKDIFAITQDFKTESLIATFESTVGNFMNKGYYTARGVSDDFEFLDRAKRNMHISGVILGVGPRYGLVIHFTDQRLLPTTEGLYAQRDDFDFDLLQNSALDVGTPVAVVHTSADGKWYYVLSATSDGWVKAADVAIGDIKDVKAYAEDKDFVICVRPKADIFVNEPMTDYYDYIRMGTRLPLAGIDEGKARVNIIPTMDKEGNLALKEAFMNSEDINPGYLPYTTRTIYKRAFDMLNQPYGWGDSFGEQDCSRFLQMVFSTVGIVLPRDSKDQAQIGTSVVEFSDIFSIPMKVDALKGATPGISILPMHGHIVLFLGMIDGRPYAIHATSGYKEPAKERDVSYSINKVVLSDLFLGEGSNRGSLIKRINKIITIK